ncbi:hypothetical protein BEP19_02300 [Ammoniphilus oxalaticus]|uniref:GtrA-like protein domain-containing protein n=2 Tax=Ammoniphilus oxalaticus TaxID=66863 RepID=A0A419SP55_9BACL|nr:hypothetical protein BEP19_02300 [Ammoniphilus oxalaticus]
MIDIFGYLFTFVANFLLSYFWIYDQASFGKSLRFSIFITLVVVVMDWIIRKRITDSSTDRY